MNLTNIKEVLEAREARVNTQCELLSSGGILVSYGLNIPGPVKNATLYGYAFETGLSQIRYVLKSMNYTLLSGKEIKESVHGSAAGPYAFFLLFPKKGQSDVEGALLVKQRMVQIEEKAEMGRLYDIDVLTRPESGASYPEKIGRSALELPARGCLVCGLNAFACVRAARHSVPEVLTKVVDLIIDSEAGMARIFDREAETDTPEEFYGELVAREALRAILYEVITTPKPGLVDAENNGSHKDMNITTFFDSAVAITPYFKNCVLEGIADYELPEEELLSRLRPLGLQAEQEMLDATGGVNTHKGAIFTLGIFCACAGVLCSRGITEGLEKEIPAMAGRILSVMENGSKGIREEAMNGYPSVVMALENLPEGKENLTGEKGVRTLLRILNMTEDSNLARRGGREAAERVRERAGEALASEDVMKAAEKLDKELIEENLSPGGSADLLAATFFLRFLGSIE